MGASETIEILETVPIIGKDGTCELYDMHVVARGERTWLGSPAPPERLAHLFRESDRRKPQTNVGLTAEYSELGGAWCGPFRVIGLSRYWAC